MPSESLASTPSILLARDLLYWYSSGLPGEVEIEAVRCLLNAVGAGIGGSRDPWTIALIGSLSEAHGQSGAPLLGHSIRLPQRPSAVVNAFAVNQNDFDDAHLETILHPGASSLAGLLASAGETTTGQEALRAFALGCEAQMVLAVALSPSHYERGWHSTATCAGLGSAVAAGLILGLDDRRLAAAIDLAVLRMPGLRQAHGTLAKGYQVGRGAANGVAAAIAVATGLVDGVPAVLNEHPCFLRGISDEEPGSLRLNNERWHLAELSYKPYPAGVVCFSGIEAALIASRDIEPGEIASIRLHVAPLVIELAGNRHPSTEAEARVSLPHGVASALAEGASGLEQFGYRAIHDPTIQRLRERVELVPRESVPLAYTELEIRTGSGLRSWLVDDPLGSPFRPLSDQELDNKVCGLVAGGNEEVVAPLLDAVRTLPQAEDLDAFANAIGPTSSRSKL